MRCPLHLTSCLLLKAFPLLGLTLLGSILSVHAQTPSFLLQINAGGPAVVPFTADADFTGGNPSSYPTDTINTAAPGAAPAAVYQSSRGGNAGSPFSYTLPGLTHGGAYTLRLHFAERWHGIAGRGGSPGAGQRLMNVTVNSSQVLTNLDVFTAASGSDTALVESLPTTANSSGQIVVSLAAAAGSPDPNVFICGLEVLGTPTTAPTGLTATPGTGKVTLAWDAVAGATGYNLYRATVSGGPYAKLPADPITGTTYTDAGLTGGTVYYYVLTALSAGGESTSTPEVSATPFAALQGLSLSPASVTGGSPSTGTVTLTGPAPTGGSVVTLTRSSTSATVPASVTVPAGSSSATFTVSTGTVASATTANFSAVYGGVTRMAALTVNPAVALSAPNDLSAVSTGSGKISLYWTQVPGATGYNVYRGTAAGGEVYAQPINGATPVNAPSYAGSGMDMFTDTSLTNGNEYFYIIEAIAANGASIASNEDSDIVDPGAVPWTSINPSDVLNAVRSAYAAGDVPVVGSLRVAGPDGQIYEDGQSQVELPDGQVTVGSNQFVFSDGDQATLNDDDGSVSATVPAGAISPLFITSLPNSHSGPYRRVRTAPGTAMPYVGAVGYFYLPTGASAHLGVTTDSLDLLLGSSSYNGSNGSKEVDAGLMYFSSSKTGLAWRPYLKTSPYRKNIVCLPRSGNMAFASGENVNIGYIAHPEGRSSGSKGVPCLVTLSYRIV